MLIKTDVQSCTCMTPRKAIRAWKPRTQDCCSCIEVMSSGWLSSTTDVYQGTCKWHVSCQNYESSSQASLTYISSLRPRTAIQSRNWRLNGSMVSQKGSFAEGLQIRKQNCVVWKRMLVITTLSKVGQKSGPFFRKLDHSVWKSTWADFSTLCPTTKTTLFAFF